MTTAVKCQFCSSTATVMMAVGMRNRSELPVCDRCQREIGQCVTRRLP